MSARVWPRPALRPRSLWLGAVLAQWCTVNVGYFAVLAVLSLYLVDTLRLPPDQAGLLLSRFQTLADFEQRRRYLERRAQMEPHRAEWRRRLGDLYAREGMLREARMQQERADEIASGDPGIRAAAARRSVTRHPGG